MLLFKIITALRIPIKFDIENFGGTPINLW